MTTGGMRAARRLRARALGTSGIAGAVVLAAGWSGAAAAQCVPEPTVANGTTTCSGTDADGLVVSTTGTTVAVAQGATVRGAPAVAVRMTATDRYDVGARVEVAGRIDGGTAGAGVLLDARTGVNGYPYYHALNLSVAAGGVVTGTTGVVLGAAGQAFATANIDNEGTVSASGPGGLALLAGGSSRFGSISNRAGGTIGAIEGSVDYLTNAGTVDGGARAALNVTGPNGLGSFENSGTLTSAGAGATVAGLATYYYRPATNSGTIANTGTGTAIEGASVALINAAGARVSAAGGTAIRTAGAVTLVNAGTVDGAVVSTVSQYFPNSYVDSVAGRINGSVTLGAGSDALVAVWRDGRVDTGITGAIDGGAGTDALRLRFGADATLSAPVALPTGFEQLVLLPGQGATATLAAGFANTGTLFLGGQGTVANRAALAGAGTVVAQDGGVSSFVSEVSAPVFVNQGSITLSAVTGSPFGSANLYAVSMGSTGGFTNAGTVSSGGGGVSVSGGGFTNTGTVTAAGVALALSGGAGTNEGGASLRSSAGVGAQVFGTTLTNAGLVEGVTDGALVASGQLINTGVVRGAQVGVRLRSYGVVDNRAGGVVTGGTTGITAAYDGGGGFSFNNVVANAGTINGNVVLGDPAGGGFGGGNSYFALPGGVLNGDLALGRGDTLVAELDGVAGSRFAGITGTVRAGSATLMLRVRGEAAASADATPGFATLGYDLFDDAALSVTGVSVPVQFAGRGSVDLTADVASGAGGTGGTTGPLITTTTVLRAPGEAEPTDPATAGNALAITSRGTLTVVRPTNDSFVSTAVRIGAGTTFTNAGTIVATDRTNGSGVVAIGGDSFYGGANGPRVVNTGTITLDGATGVSGVSRVTNTGTIAQAAGAARAATGVRSGFEALALVNSGTIEVGGAAVVADYYGLTVENSARLASTGGAAITQLSGGRATVTNAAGGTIAGVGAAIRLGGGTLTNAGAIAGTVDLGYFQYGRSYSDGAYVADGGTVAGDLLFGSGSDTLVSFGELGVSGRIDGGEGQDSYVQARRTSGDVTLALPAGVTGFERLGARALGADTVVTLRGDGPVVGDVAVSGDGGIVNAVELAGRVSVRSVSSQPFDAPAELLGSFTNRAAIRGGFDGAVRAFVNEADGTVGDEALAGPAVRVSTAEALSFDNRGRVLNDGGTAGASLFATGGVSATNAGVVTGGLSAQSYTNGQVADREVPAPVSVSLVNSGTITGVAADVPVDPFNPFGQTGEAVQLFASALSGGTAAASLVNSGLIETVRPGTVAASVAAYGADGEGAARSLTVTNTGTIRANAGGEERSYFGIPPLHHPGDRAAAGVQRGRRGRHGRHRRQHRHHRGDGRAQHRAGHVRRGAGPDQLGHYPGHGGLDPGVRHRTDRADLLYRRRDPGGRRGGGPGGQHRHRHRIGRLGRG